MPIEAGPDHPYLTILLRHGGKQLKMSSWHEPAEARGATVTSSGILLGARDRPRVEELAHQPAWYLHFHLFWCEIRRTLDWLIPGIGEEIAGRPVMENREILWQEP